MKKAAAVLFLFLFVPLLLAGAPQQSGQNISVFQSFSHDGVLYAYINAPDAEEEALSISARIGDNAYPRIRPVATVEQAAVPSYFIILVDTSASAAPFRSQIEEFVTAFLDETADGTQFLLAAFGESFAPSDEFTDSRDGIKTALAELSYNAEKTGLYTGIYEAADYFGERTQGELHQIILITDGIEADKNGVTAEEVRDKLRSTPVAVHTLGLFNKQGADAGGAKESLKVLGSFARVSMGLHNVLGYDNRSAAELAAEIPAYINRLHAAEFDISGFRSAGREYNVVFSLRDGNKPLADLECTVKIPLAALNFPYENGSQEPFVPEQKQEPHSSEPPAISEEQTDTNTDSLPSDYCGTPYLICLLGAAAAVLLAAAGIFLAVRKKKKRKTCTGGSPVSGDSNGIFMRLEVINGNYRGKGSEYYLKSELAIGRNKACDIVFKDKDVSGKNSRVFLHDNAIYLEDLGSQNGTSISNMRIHTQNRLRSGDVISIGSVCFTLKF